MYNVEFESGSVTAVRRFDVYPYVHARSVSSRTVVMRLFASYRNCKYCPESSWTFESRLLPSYVSVSLFPLRSVIRTSRPAAVKFPLFPWDQNKVYVPSPFFTSFEAESPAGEEYRLDPSEVYTWREPSSSFIVMSVEPESDTLYS